MPYLNILSGVSPFKGGGDNVEVDKTPFRIGRAKECDCVLEPLFVSSIHCEIYLDEGVYKIRDLDSSNGTYVGGVKIGGDVKILSDMDIIRLSPDPDSVSFSFVSSTLKVQPALFAIDTKKREIRISGSLKSLTALEFDILDYLYSHQGEWCKNNAIIKNAWAANEVADENTVASGIPQADDLVLQKHIANIRKKIEPNPKKPSLLINSRGVGYMLNI